MFTVDINPVAFTLGSLSFQWDTIWMIIGILVALLISLIEGKRNGIPNKHIIRAYLLIIFLALFCARIFNIVENVLYYNDLGPLLTLTGIRIYGAIGGAALAIFIYSRFFHFQFFKLTDSGIIALISCLTVLRIGCFIVGCCYGLPCELPWSIQYSDANAIALTNIPIHPTQIYHFIASGIAVVAGWFLRNIWKQAGALTCFCVALFCCGDLVVRFFRANEPIPSISFIIGILLFIASLTVFFFKTRTKH